MNGTMSMDFRHITLPNGLDVVAEVNPSAATLAVGFFVRTGSRDETPGVAGVSHFLEHMVFKGTPRRTPFDVNREFDEMGANYNAFTSEENTVYFGAVLPEFQDRLVDLLADIVRPSLRQEDFDVEKKVILEEIALYEDRPQYRVFEKLMAAFFAPHPLANSVLGTPESVTALTRDAMQAYFDSRYSPGNITVVAVGKLDFDRLVEQVRSLCGGWPVAQAPRELPTPPGRCGMTLLTDAKVARQHMGIASLAPSGQDPDRFAAELVAAIIGDSTGSRLFYALIEPALADEASTTFEPMDGAGMFMTFVSADPDRAAKALRVAQAELKRFQDEGPTEAEMTAAKNKIASSATLKGELPMGRLRAVGFDWMYRREYVPLARQIDILLNVTVDDVLRVARAHDLTRNSALALGPLEKM
jgi:predicted Zn-dependent peptidase